VHKKLAFTGLTPSAAASDAAAAAPATTAKHLTFSAVRATPVAFGRGTAGAKSAGRRVTFGAGTLSPSSRLPRRNSLLAAMATPPAAGGAGGCGDAILEEDAASGGSVNSRNAGATPFSGLLRKCQGGQGGESPGSQGDPSAESAITSLPGKHRSGALPALDALTPGVERAGGGRAAVGVGAREGEAAVE
jgi:hypothetical protein